MNIEQIAKETWAEVSKTSTVGESIAVKFANALLAKIGEGLEPVAHDITYLNQNCYLDKTILRGSLDEVREFFGKFGMSFQKSEPLYATPHEVIIAAEQRVAEACAKMFDGAGIGGNFAADAIRSGEWRKHQ